MRPHNKHFIHFLKAKAFRLLGFVLFLATLIACQEERKFEGDLSFYLPPNAEMVVRTLDPKDIVSELESNSFLPGFNTSKSLPGLSRAFKKFDSIDPEGETWLAMTRVNDSLAGFSLITKVPDSTATDSLAASGVFKSLINNSGSIQVIPTEGDSIYAILKESVIIAATSRILLESSLEGPGIEGQDFEQLTSSLDGDQASVFVKSGMAKDLGVGENWTGISLDLKPDSFGFNSIAVDRDSTSIWRSGSFGNISRLAAATVVPSNTNILIERSYKHNDTLLENTEELSDLLLDNISGYGYFESNDGRALLLKVIDSLNFRELVAPFSNSMDRFKDVERFALTDSLSLNDELDNWARIGAVSEYFRLDEYFIFTSDPEVSEYIINNYRNNASLASTSDHKFIDERLSDAAHIRVSGDVDLVANYLKMDKSGLLGSELGTNKRQIHQLLVLQFSQENNQVFAQGQTVQTIINDEVDGIRELINMKLQQTPLGSPKWFSNHRTKGKDVVYQKADNSIGLFAYNGTSYWSRDLDEAILGEIQEVDILRNGKKQLAFATASRLYVIDRNGKDVAPFPIKFKDEVTQPLAIFDYDNNRKYRFVIVQDKDILMYDSKAKIVKGFTFTKAPNSLAMPPQHLRIGNKDYLTFPLSDGKLLIKSRVGKDRITVSEQFEFGSSPIFQEQGSFVFISGEDTKISIDSRGRVTKKDLGVEQGFSLVIEGNTKVSLDENLLRINGRLYELPYGVYSAPKIDQVGRTRYVSLADLQEKKVYVFNTNGDLLPNFPVYGSEFSTIADANRNRRPNLLTMSDEQTIIIYEF